MMTRRSGSKSFAARSSTSPSRSGSRRSVRTTSGDSRRNSSSAAWPRIAVTTRKPSCWRMRRPLSIMNSSSSTRSTVSPDFDIAASPSRIQENRRNNPAKNKAGAPQDATPRAPPRCSDARGAEVRESRQRASGGSQRSQATSRQAPALAGRQRGSKPLKLPGVQSPPASRKAATCSRVTQKSPSRPCWGPCQSDPPVTRSPVRCAAASSRGHWPAGVRRR